MLLGNVLNIEPSQCIVVNDDVFFVNISLDVMFSNYSFCAKKSVKSNLSRRLGDCEITVSICAHKVEVLWM